MTYESEWDGFAAQTQSGIAEALYVAGVDCTICPHGEPLRSHSRMRSKRAMPLYHAERPGKAPVHCAAPLEIEASLIGGGLGIEPSQVQAQLQEGKISTLCERGIGADQGRYRVTFYCGKRRFRILMDESGNFIEELERR